MFRLGALGFLNMINVRVTVCQQKNVVLFNVLNWRTLINATLETCTVFF